MTRNGPPAHRPLPWRHLVTIAVVMTLGVSLLWAVIGRVDTTDVPRDEPTAAASGATVPPTIESSTATPALDGTPDPDDGPVWPAGSLPALLAMAPDRLSDGSLPLNDVASYADVAGWMAASNLPLPAGLDDPGLATWETGLESLALPSTLRERGLDPAWQRTYGFSLLDIEQVLVVGQTPDYIMIMRGDFDAATLQAAWVASGYQPVEVEGHTIWSLYPGDQIDLSAQESRTAMGTLNNVILLEDGTLVAAAKMSRLGATLRVVDGEDPSLAGQDDVAALLVPGSGIDSLASAVIARGTLLQAGTRALPAGLSTPVAPVASPMAGAPPPAPLLVLAGIPLVPAATMATPVAHPPPPAMILRVVYEDADDVSQAARTALARLTNDRSAVTGEPYTARLRQPRVMLTSTGERYVLQVEGGLVGGSADWLTILASRDLGFLAWLPEP